MADVNVPADPRECFEALTLKIGRLQAMLQIISGGGQENFALYDEELRDRYLYFCADLAGEALELAQPLWEHLKDRRSANLPAH